MCHELMCNAEAAAFERWASSQGGLTRARRFAEYSHRARMHVKWRKSSEFEAWLQTHSSHCIGVFEDMPSHTREAEGKRVMTCTRAA